MSNTQTSNILARFPLEIESVGERRPIEIEIDNPIAEASRFTCSANISGLENAQVLASGKNLREAVATAIDMVSRILNEVESKGSRLFYSGRLLAAFQMPELFQGVLARFGNCGSQIIIGGPTPTKHGDVIFQVDVDGTPVTVTRSPMGIGVVDCEDIQLGNLAMRAVGEWVKSRMDDEWQWYRRAAALRKEAGISRLAGNSKSYGVHLVGVPTRKNNSIVVFNLRVSNVELSIDLIDNRTFLDNTEHLDLVSDSDRDAALGLVLDYIIDHREESARLGIDVDAIFELWC